MTCPKVDTAGKVIFPWCMVCFLLSSVFVQITATFPNYCSVLFILWNESLKYTKTENSVWITRTLSCTILTDIHRFFFCLFVSSYLEKKYKILEHKRVFNVAGQWMKNYIKKYYWMRFPSGGLFSHEGALSHWTIESTSPKPRQHTRHCPWPKISSSIKRNETIYPHGE